MFSMQAETGRGMGVFLFVLALLCATILVPGAALADSDSDSDSDSDVNLQILAINDLHGNIDSRFFFFGQQVGGADYLATHLRDLEAQADHTIIVSAGDLIGASPLISALFHDEPTIEAANLLGLAINAVGNHEFDEGPAELLRMQNGGCHPVDGCQDGDGFGGAEFQFLSANVFVDDDGDGDSDSDSDSDGGATLFPPVEIREFGDVEVAFIGVTLEATPSIVIPTGVAGLTFVDEADTINAIVPVLQDEGVEAIVVLIHEGGSQDFSGGLNDCVNISGPIVDVVERTDPAVDLFITGHTHRFYNCVIDGRTVTSAGSFGRLFSKIDVVLDGDTEDMTVLAVDNRFNTRDVTPAADLRALLDKYAALTAPLGDQVVGTITADITHFFGGESALGDVIGDSQLAATAAPGFGDADVAFMNPGGIRTNLTFAASGSEADGEVTFAEVFAVLPFGDSLVTMTLTGAQIETLLELQFDNPVPGVNRILQPSASLRYEWSLTAPAGSKIDPASITIGGVPINLTADYRVTVNSFLAGGGDNFGSVLTAGTNRLGGAQTDDALAAYIGASSPVAPGPQDRVVQIP